MTRRIVALACTGGPKRSAMAEPTYDFFEKFPCTLHLGLVGIFQYQRVEDIA